MDMLNPGPVDDNGWNVPTWYKLRDSLKPSTSVPRFPKHLPCRIHALDGPFGLAAGSHSVSMV